MQSTGIPPGLCTWNYSGVGDLQCLWSVTPHLQLVQNSTICNKYLFRIYMCVRRCNWFSIQFLRLWILVGFGLWSLLLDLVRAHVPDGERGNQRQVSITMKINRLVIFFECFYYILNFEWTFECIRIVVGKFLYFSQ